jgi:thiamine pyrophosphate-dependent acetolactate synthase large subunit-like protein
MDYWPKDASIIQVDMNSDRIGLTKKVTVGICGDAKLVSQQFLLNFHQQQVILIDKKEKISFIKQNQLGYKNYQVLIMKMMMKAQFGIKKLEKETQIECLLDKLGEQFKLECLMM